MNPDLYMESMSDGNDTEGAGHHDFDNKQSYHGVSSKSGITKTDKSQRLTDLNFSQANPFD